MTKTQMVNKFYKMHHVTKDKANDYVTSVFNIMKDAIKEDGSVSFPKFGKFDTVEVKERTQVVPLNGQVVTVPAHKRVRFRPFSELKDDMNA